MGKMEKVAAPPLIPAALALGGKALAWLGAGSKAMGLLNAAMYGSTAWDMAKGLKGVFAKTPRRPMGMPGQGMMPQQGVLSSYSRYGPYGFAHMAELQERFLAFQSGIDRFCKEAKFDEDDRAAMYALVKKAMATAGPVSPWIRKEDEPSEKLVTNPGIIPVLGSTPRPPRSWAGRAGQQSVQMHDPNNVWGSMWGSHWNPLNLFGATEALGEQAAKWWDKTEYEKGQRYAKQLRNYEREKAREQELMENPLHARARSEQIAQKMQDEIKNTALMPHNIQAVFNSVGGSPIATLAQMRTQMKMEDSPLTAVGDEIQKAYPAFFEKNPTMAKFLQAEKNKEQQRAQAERESRNVPPNPADAAEARARAYLDAERARSQGGGQAPGVPQMEMALNAFRARYPGAQQPAALPGGGWGGIVPPREESRGMNPRQQAMEMDAQAIALGGRAPAPVDLALNPGERATPVANIQQGPVPSDLAKMGPGAAPNVPAMPPGAPAQPPAQMPGGGGEVALHIPGRGMMNLPRGGGAVPPPSPGPAAPGPGTEVASKKPEVPGAAT